MQQIRRRLAIVAIILTLALPSWVGAATVTIGDNSGNTHAGTEDTKIRQAEPTTNFGGGANSEVTKYSAGDHTHTVIKFPGLSSITGPVTVSSATLYVWLEGTDGSTNTLAARRLLRNWVENQATWNIYSTGNSWTTAGGLSDGNDRSATISGSGSFSAAGAYYGITGAQLATDVQNIINGSASNFGWHLERSDGANDGAYKVITTSEGTNTHRPYLDVTYTTEGGGGGVVGGTRLGLHVTAEELAVWRSRRTDNVTTMNGFTFQSIYQNRILADANTFRSQGHPGGDGFWTGRSSCPSSDRPANGGTPFNRGNGAYMAKSAFVFMLTGDTSYANPVRTELLNQIAQAGTNWNNSSLWGPMGGLNFCVTSQNLIEVTPWVMRLITAYDYLIAGGYTGFSTAEQNSIKQWFVDAAQLWRLSMEAAVDTYSGLYATPQTLNCTNHCATNATILYLGGPTPKLATELTFGSVGAWVGALSMMAGTLANNSALITHATRLYTGFITAGIWDNGAIAPYNRWVDCTPNCPGSAWIHGSNAWTALTSIADIRARLGDTSLYDLAPATQVLGGSGGTVNLRKIYELLANIVNGSVVLRTGDNLYDINWNVYHPTCCDLSNLGDFYNHFNGMVANLYYRDSNITTAMQHNTLRDNSSNTGCYDPQNGGCFNGDGVHYADLPFMFGRMENNAANPYLAAPPTGSGQLGIKIFRKLK